MFSNQHSCIARLKKSRVCSAAEVDKPHVPVFVFHLTLGVHVNLALLPGDCLKIGHVGDRLGIGRVARYGSADNTADTRCIHLGLVLDRQHRPM